MKVKVVEKIEKNTESISKAQQVVNAVWPFISTRKARIVLLLGIVAIGMVFNWGWFVAAGLAPIILGILPCAAMCAMGLCMQPGKEGSCSKNKSNDPE